MTWLPIDDFPYEVSVDGQVRRATTKRLLKPQSTNSGYLRVDLRKNGRQRRTTVHTLVLEAFVGPRPEGHEAAHLDGDRLNNSASNLAWKSHLDNIRDKWKHNTMPTGERHPKSLLTDQEYSAIVDSDESHSRTGEKYGVSKGTVAAIRRRHRLRTNT